MKGRILAIVSWLFLLPFGLMAQSAYQEIREGNKAYNETQYDKSEDLFRKSLQKDPAPVESAYNLGNALYRQGKYEDAARYFGMAAEKAKDKDIKSNAYQNLGNSLLKSKKIEESINAYKNSLIQQPNNADSRYNLAYANRLLQQQQQQKQEEKEGKKQQEENKGEDKKEQEQQEQEQEQQQDKEEEQKDEQQEQEPQQKEQEISREDAKRMLEAVDQKEKEIQEQLKKKKVKSVDIDIEKDW